MRCHRWFKSKTVKITNILEEFEDDHRLKFTVATNL